MSKHYYIAIEGIDGSGKTTLVNLLGKLLTTKYPDREILLYREPGGSSLGVTLRSIAIDASHYSSGCRGLAISLDRAMMLQEKVIPALERGAIVLSDRCFLSTLVYQSYAEFLPLNSIIALCDLAIQDVVPDSILWIDTPVNIAMSDRKSTRLNSSHRNTSRMPSSA